MKPISISLSPNTEKDDILLALKTIFSANLWKKGKAIELLEEEFQNYLGLKYINAFNSGRSAFLAILSALNFRKGDEILLQAFTCNAVPNPIIWNNLKPIFVDMDEKTFNIDIDDLRKKITSRSRAVVVQHTFGQPAEMDEILEICRKNNLILIEDCAHALGASYKGRKVGTFGNAAFFSFGRDKIISSVYGGMVATNDENLAEKIKEFQEKTEYPSDFWIFQQLLHPILTNYLVLPFYGFLNLGKAFLILFQRLGILSKAVNEKEKKGEMPGYFPGRMPNALAILALNQFKKMERFNNHRRQIADFYYKELRNSSFGLPINLSDRFQVFLRFAINNPNVRELIKKAWKKNILIGDWYTAPVAPHDTKLEKVGYISGICPKAEKMAKITLNLPTGINVSEKEAGIIVDFLKKSLYEF